jgi:two-component system chemotaxis response regulator CheB
VETIRTSILIVDDSAVMRSLLRSVVKGDATLEVGGTAADGVSALSLLDSFHPDLVLLDVEMPRMDGLATLKQLRARGHRMPVIMCSSLTHRGAKVTIEALAGGASDYVAKPVGQPDRETAMRTLSQDLIPKIHALTRRKLDISASLFTRKEVMPRPAPSRLPGSIAPPYPASLRPDTANATPAVLIIGVSTGGPAALDNLLPALPAGFPLPVLIVQHMPELFTGLFAERLNGRCKLHAREAAEGDAVLPGTIYIARGNWHMEVTGTAGRGAPAILHLGQGPLENHCRPAADVLFRSAASVYGAGVLALVLTGMGSDGLIGCRIVRGLGGTILAQDEATSTVWGMPGAVANAGLADKILPLDAIVPEILRIASRTSNQQNILRGMAG